MKRIILTSCFFLGALSLTMASNNNGVAKNKTSKEAKKTETIQNAKKPMQKIAQPKKAATANYFACTLTGTCPNGSSITVTAVNCETAGRMVDAACGSVSTLDN